MITNKDMDQVFQALSHQTRRTILDLLRENPGWAVGKLAAQFDCSRIAIMNHLGVLETAGLVLSEKDGRSRRLYLNQAPIQMIYERWTDEYAAHWGKRVTSIKRAAEQAVRDGTKEQPKEGNNNE